MKPNPWRNWCSWSLLQFVFFMALALYVFLGVFVGHKPILTPAKQLAYAIAEARKRWGVNGFAWHPKYAPIGSLNHCCVGIKEGQQEHQRVVYGIGMTFTEAFADSKERGF